MSDACLCGAAEVPKKTICSQRLSEPNAATFRKAVQKHYWYGSTPCIHTAVVTFAPKPLIETIKSLMSLGCCRYELFIDDLPVWGFVGPPPEETKDEEHIYIYTHKSFDINYNDNRVRTPSHISNLAPASQLCDPNALAQQEVRVTTFSCRVLMSQAAVQSSMPGRA
jgi:hypothetical protein